MVVGSHALGICGNMLGVKWPSETTRTQDVDIAAAYRVLIGMPDRKVNLQQALMESEFGFIEVPALDRKAPSTRFRIKGKQLSVDVLTPLLGRNSTKPIHLAALDTYAEPVRFLDYLLSDTQPAILVARAGILLNVPAPAPYALYKLVTAERRRRIPNKDEERHLSGGATHHRARTRPARRHTPRVEHRPEPATQVHDAAAREDGAIIERRASCTKADGGEEELGKVVAQDEPSGRLKPKSTARYFQNECNRHTRKPSPVG